MYIIDHDENNSEVEVIIYVVMNTYIHIYVPHIM